MKAQAIQIDGIDRDDLIVLIEPDGNWSIITTKLDVEEYISPFATKDNYGTIERHGDIIAAEEDVKFVGGPFDIVFDFARLI